LIKNIIFDFGDIFINLDKKAPEIALQKSGIEEIDEKMQQINDCYEKGLISDEELIAYYTERFTSLTPVAFTLAWNSIILDFPEHRLQWIEALSRKREYRLFLLSNTNDLHIEQVIKNMGAVRFARFQQCFEQFYLSQNMKMRKPDLEIFDFVLNENKLRPEETLFIDDTLVNTMGAASLGMHTWHLSVGQEDITDLFSIKVDLF
tara:strand:- start:5284 stop:5898 length:615 start_codon:yes stop_codon:yes gene_type:complete